MLHRPSSLLMLAAAALFGAASLPAAEQGLPKQLEDVRIDERLDERIDLDLSFTAENGYMVSLRQYFRKERPVILNLVYYSCPMLCNLVLNGQVGALREIPWTPGKEFEVVTISIDPKEHYGLAREKKALYLESYDRPAPGWHFLTDHNGNVKKLAQQVGFNYTYDARTGQYAHAAAIMVLTPDGRVSRYLYGIKYRSRDVRLALTEAAEGRYGLSVERLLLFCFHYDPQAGSYVPFATNIMRGGGVLIMLVLGLVLLRLWRRERQIKVAGNLAGIS